MSTNATRVYTYKDIPVMVGMRERHPYARLSQHFTLPFKEIATKIPLWEKTIIKNLSQLVADCWDPSYQAANIVLCTTIATDVLIHRGWHYLACPWCGKQVSVNGGNLRCSECVIKVDDLIARLYSKDKF
ncbi:hypothetical protein MKX01_035106 [Papaver californicum]|nr:hypothetical protein MKX01_035106 [Papaver californicum]